MAEPDSRPQPSDPRAPGWLPSQAGAPARPSGTRRFSTPVRWLGAITILLIIALVALLALFRWDWLRGPIDSYASARMHRQVVIRGELSGRIWTWSPSLTANDVTVSQPAWAGTGQMASIPRLTVAVDLKALFGGRLVLDLVDAQHPQVTLERDVQGRDNWNFGTANQPQQALKLPPIRHFNIAEGRLVLDDAERRLHFAGQVSSNEQVSGYGRGRFNLVGDGTLNATAFHAQLSGGPLINVDPDKPYPFSTDVRAGTTRVVATGTIPHPFDLGDFQATGRASGEDLASLYYLTGYTFPDSPPYQLAASINRQGARIDVTGLHGQIGSSDVSGHLMAQKANGRRRLTGDLASRRLKFADLSAIIGGAPRGVLKGAVASPMQQAEATKLTAEHRVLPDARLDIGRFRQMDADIRYHADSVDAGPLPLRQLTLHAQLEKGQLIVDPLALTLPQGEVLGSVRLNTNGATPVTSVNLALHNAQLQELLPARPGALPPLSGTLQARVQLIGSGASVRATAGSANGVVAVAIPQGQMRQLLAELMGIDVTKSLFLYLSKDQKPTPVRCAVAEFRAHDGVLTAQRLLVDTGEVLAQGGGTVDLRDETLNLELSGKPKHFSLVRIAAPITLKGRLDDPKLGIDLSKALPQAGAAVALGVLATPVAAVLPLVGIGRAKDANCGALLAEAAADVAPIGR